MNKKIVTLIIVILLSFCFLSIVVADSTLHDDNNTVGPDNNTTDNKIDDKPKSNYIIAKGNGNKITFSNGFIGFRLDYSKSPASSGDEFKPVSTSKIGNSNTLKLAIIECYKQGLTGQIEKIMADFIKIGSSNTPVGKAVAASHEKVSDHVTVKINDYTVVIFEFKLLKSVSGNESDYFAYKVSFIILDDSEDINGATDLTNLSDTTNITNITSLSNNETNTTFLEDLYDFLEFLANTLYDAWKPIIDTLINGFLMITHALEEVVKLFENIMTEIQALIDALGQLLNVLGSISEGLNGLLKLLSLILTALGQLLNLIGYILNLITWIISLIISIIQQILGLVSSIINFIVNIINQIIALIQAVLDLLKSVGNSMIKVTENIGIIINTFVIITFGAYIYNNKR